MEELPLWKQYRTEYSVWAQMKNRCNSPKHPQYKYWGGKGIKVCTRWHTFEYFLSDMGKRPAKGYSLERRDSNKDYEPSNCYWATFIQQNNNLSRNIKLTYSGETLSLAQWGRKLGIPYDRIRQRYRYGWSTDKILTVPKNQHHTKY